VVLKPQLTGVATFILSVPQNINYLLPVRRGIKTKPTAGRPAERKNMATKKVNIKNKNAGIRNAFYQSTGRKAKTLREAKAYFGIK